MRVVFISQDDPIYVREFFDELFRLDHDDIEIVEIVLAPAMGKQTLSGLISQMWQFYGPIDFIRMGVRFVATKIAIRLPRFLRVGRAFSIGQLAEAFGVPVRYGQNLNDPVFVEWISDKKIDVVVSVAATQIIKKDLIDAPRLGCINIHNGKLPRYRGMLPNFWQMYDGQPTSGTTVHRMNERIDDGAILAQSETAIDPGDSLDAVIRRTKRSGAKAILDVLRQMRDGTCVEIENKKDDSSYHSFPTAQDIREFRRRGYKLL